MRNPLYSVTNCLCVLQERPCARCIKRNIGHLCHDEPREPETATKKAKKQHSNSTVEEGTATADQRQGDIEGGMSNSVELPQEQSQDNNSLTSGTTPLSQGGPLQLVQPSPVSGIQANALSSNSRQCKLLSWPQSALKIEYHHVLMGVQFSGIQMTGLGHRANSKICIIITLLICSTRRRLQLSTIS